MKRLAAWMAVILAGALICYGAVAWPIGNGKKAIAEIAAQNGACEDEACVEGLEAMYDFMTSEHHMSRSLINWCIGVEDWASDRAYGGVWLANMLAGEMYLLCGNLNNQPNGE